MPDGSSRKSMMIWVAESLPPAVMLCAAIFVAGLLGASTRTLDNWAMLWPANALLIGLMLRCPRLNVVAGWMGAIAGYCMAEFVHGGQWLPTILLTFANLASASTGVFLFSRINKIHQKLQHPQSIFILAMIAAASACMAAFAGAIINARSFQSGIFIGWAYWFVGELVNIIVLLPAILTLPEELFSRHVELHRKLTHLSQKFAS